MNSLNFAKQAKEIMQKSLVWDNHICLPLRKDDTSFYNQLDSLRSLGYNVVTINIGFDIHPWENGIEVLATMRQWFKLNQDKYLLIHSASDLIRAQEESKLGILFDIEGATALNNHLPMIQLYYDLGVRWMLLAYNQNNSAAGGCQSNDMGLTDFGREVVAEMERVGMLVCCSHTSEKAAKDVFDIATKPVLFSHSNPSALVPHIRNVSDDMIKACAKTGGVIGITGVGIFLGQNDPTPEKIANHIDHVCQLVGSEHASLALDHAFDREEMIDWVRANPETYDPKIFGGGIEIATPEQVVSVVEELLKKNYTEVDISNVLGGNLQRIATQVWK